MLCSIRSLISFSCCFVFSFQSLLSCLCCVSYEELIYRAVSLSKSSRCWAWRRPVGLKSCMKESRDCFGPRLRMAARFGESSDRGDLLRRRSVGSRTPSTLTSFIEPMIEVAAGWCTPSFSWTEAACSSKLFWSSVRIIGICLIVTSVRLLVNMLLRVDFDLLEALLLLCSLMLLMLADFCPFFALGGLLL